MGYFPAAYWGGSGAGAVAAPAVAGTAFAQLPVPFSGVDLSRDYLTWDNTQSVGYTSQRVTGPQDFTLPVVKRRAMKKSEKFPSGGVYVSKGVKFLVPTATLEAGLLPKPGDILHPDDGDFVVIDADPCKLDGSGIYQTWQLYALNLSIEHDLQDVIDIERATITYDAGTKRKSWPSQGGGGSVLYPRLACRVQNQSDDVREELGITGFTGSFVVIVEKQLPLLQSEDRIRWVTKGGSVVTYLEIRGVKNPARIDELPLIDAEVYA